MLKGEITTAPLPEVLRQLAESASTGCLRVSDRALGRTTEDARLFLRDGRVYALTLPDRRPQLGARLVASGELEPEELAEAYEAQRTELQGWRLGELLVHLGYVEQNVVESFVADQLREAASELLLWPSGHWRFRVDERTREDIVPPVSVDDLLTEVDRRHEAWERMRPVVHGPDAVPALSAAGTSPDTLSLDAGAWSLLCTVDGVSTLSQLAGSNGLWLVEAAQVVVGLVEAGLLEVEPPSHAAPDDPPADPPAEEAVEDAVSAPFLEPPALPASEPAAIASRLAEALRGLGPVPTLPPAMTATVMDGEELTRALALPVDDLSVAGSICRASESLAAALPALDTTATDDDPSDAPLAPVQATPEPLDEEQAKRRARDAQELADRHAEFEAARTQAAAFAELSAAATLAPAEPVPAEPAPDPAAEDVEEPVPALEPAPELAYFERGADTAALMRELSSLGLDEEPPAPPQQRPSNPATTGVVRAGSATVTKKRKGLFGRS